MAFYKRNNETLLTAPNFVHGPDFSLTAENHTEQAYPVDGWYWFDTLDEAMQALSKSAVTGSISMRQARLRLLSLGVYDQVNTAIRSMSQAAQIEWEYATAVQRENPLVLAMTQLLGWSADDLDAYLAEAANL